MKKILIATSAIAAVSATSAFALDVKTSGTVEYKYTKNKTGNTAQNAKLSKGTAEVKFAASGASNGLAYGAFVKFKSNAGADRKVEASKKDTVVSATTGNISADKFLGWAENGVAVAEISKPTGGAATGLIVKDTSANETITSAKVANNATADSAIWVSGAFGKVVVGQDGSASFLAVSGAVAAAGFEKGTMVAKSGVYQQSNERLTYTAPTFVDGLTIAYTHSFKGNTNTATDKKSKAPSNYGIQYATNLMGVGVKVGHAVGKTGVKDGTEQTKTIGSASTSSADFETTTVTTTGFTNSTTVKYTEKQRTNTATGIELAYGNFTVGYGVFNNEKKYYQTKDTSGSNYGVKYSGGAWAVGYTVMKSEDKNKYYGAKTTKSASTNAISASYQIADGFSAYASKSSNKVKGTDGKTTKNNYTIIGAKISF